MDKQAVPANRLYKWTLSLATRKSAEAWLAIIAFVESSIFFVPADLIYLPMALASPQRAYRYALTATIASTLGGVVGYLLGFYAYQLIAVPILEFYGRFDDFEALRHCAGRETTMVLLLTSGLTHLPPIKVVTILSGVVHVGIVFFIIACIFARGARFFALAYALRKWGISIRTALEHYPWPIAGLAALILIGSYFGLKLLTGSQGFVNC